MARRKLIQIDYQDLLDYDGVYQITVCLTQRQVAILKALLTTAYWTTRWTNLAITPDILHAQISQIEAQLDGNNCEVQVTDFRDNPLDPCEVQYSHDGGETWLTMFRKDICVTPPGIGDVTIWQETNIYVELNHTVWEGDIVNVAPEWEYVNEWNDRALCWSLDMYVNAMCDTAIAQIKTNNQNRRETNDWIDDLSVVISGSIIASIAAVATASILWPALAIAAVGWATARIVESIWDTLLTDSYAAFEDEDVRDQMKCMMYYAMKGSTPQFPAWRDSLSYFTSMGDDAREVAMFLYAINQDEDTYINWLVLTAELNDIGESLPECSCAATWSHFWDFANNGKEQWILTDIQLGSYVPDVGWQGEIDHPTTYYLNLIQALTLDEIIPNCTAFQIHYTVIKGTFDTNYIVLAMYVPPRETETQYQGWLFTGTDDWTHTFELADLTYVALYFNCCYTEAGDYGNIIITGITLKGDGYDPFFGRDTG